MTQISDATPADIENEPFGPAWRSALGAALGLTVGPSVLLVMAFGVFLPALRAEFGWSLAQGAAGSAIISVAIVLTSPLQGFLCDRLGACKMILASALPFGIGVILLGAMPGDLRVFYAACALLPLLGVGLWPVTYNKAAAGWFDRRLGLAMGVVAAGIGVGAMIVPALAAQFIATIGWRHGYQILGLVSLVVTLLAATLLLRKPPAPAATADTETGDSFGEALRRTDYRILLVAFMLLGIVSSAALVHQSTLLLETGFSLREVGLIHGVVGAAVIVGRLGVGWMLDRIAIRWIMPPLLLAAAVGCAAYATGTTGIAIQLSAAAIGLMLGAEMDVLGYLIRRNHGTRAFGALYGLVFALFSLGSAIGAIAVGRLHAVLGGYAMPFFGLALILVVSAAIFATPAFARRPLNPEPIR